MSQAPPIRVVFADDDPASRTGRLATLAAEPRIEVIAVAVDGVAAVRTIARLEPDVALLDLRRPGLTGPEVAGALASARPALRTRVVVLEEQLPDQARAAEGSDRAGRRRRFCATVIDHAARRDSVPPAGG